MCLDAGDYLHDQGEQLFLWECNGRAQQTWGFDSKMKTVYLSQSLGSRNLSHPDASLCLDVAGKSSKPGAHVDVWPCSGLWNQQFWVAPGYAPIAHWEDSSLCIDLPGGKIYNGAPLQIWHCNKLTSQMWWFGVDDWKVRYVYDMSYCIDAGDMKQGSVLTLWKCNGLGQQRWGYDAQESTIYLGDSASDASVCMDALGGTPKAGGQIGAWGCNGLTSQQWLVQWYGDGFASSRSPKSVLV